MEEIILYVFKKYGLRLSLTEANDFIDWYKANNNSFIDEDSMDKEARKYLYNKYKGRPLLLHEEDLSNMKYLLSLLKKETQKNR